MSRNRSSTQDEAETVNGFVAPGFERVRDEFVRNLAERGEVGAAFAVVRDGRPIVDLWGGVADRRAGAMWRDDTMVCIFSGTKGLVAVCILILLERGLLDLNESVAHYWPEFAASGKGRVLVRDVVSHTARLPGLETPVSWEAATDAQRMAELLAAQPLNNDPRAAATYHSLTYGWLCGELIRRVDGRSVGQFFAEEVASMLELDLYIGLPEKARPRVARVDLGPAWIGSTAAFAAQLQSDHLLRSIVANPPRYQPHSFPWNEWLWQKAEVPGANAIGTARSIAALYANLDRLLRPETLALACRPLSIRQDTLHDVPSAFGVGFALQTEEMMLGPKVEAFGHGGAGGSRHGCWPKHRVGFSYAMNLMRDDAQDVRAKVLLEALSHSLGQG